MRQRPVLMPGGWPSEINERERCAQAVLASGGDFERIYDESELGIETYVRHVTRVPFCKLAKENPLLVITGKIQSVVTLLAVYTRLFELTNQFDNASWLAYLARDTLADFLEDAKAWADTESLGDNLYVWYTSPVPILVVSKESKLTRLRQIIADLELAPASGVIAVSGATPPGTTQADESDNLPEHKASSSLSSNSLGRVTPTPPSNPRIRRVTG